MSWILNSISPSIAQSVIFLECAVDIWDDLRERFSQSDLLRIAELQDEIYGMSQNNRIVSEFYTTLKTMWEELDNYRPFPVCTWDAKKYHQQDFIIHFLKGLDDRFSVVRSQILLMDPFSAINRVFSMVVQQERQLHVPSSASSEPNSFVNATANSFQGKGRGGYGSTSTVKGAVFSKKCAYCHRAGHTADVCWGKHGYPLGHPRYPGHPRFNNHNSSSSANSVVVDEVVEGSCSHSGTSSSNPINLTQAQYQSLMALIQPMQLKSTSDSIGPHSPHQANLLHAIPNGPKRVSKSNGGSHFVLCTTHYK